MVSAFKYALQREELRLREGGQTEPKNYSNKKAVNARCYVRYVNDNFYWGLIACTYLEDEQKMYSVSNENASGIACSVTL